MGLFRRLGHWRWCCWPRPLRRYLRSCHAGEKFCRGLAEAARQEPASFTPRQGAHCHGGSIATAQIGALPPPPPSLTLYTLIITFVSVSLKEGQFKYNGKIEVCLSSIRVYLIAVICILFKGALYFDDTLHCNLFLWISMTVTLNIPNYYLKLQ